MTRTCSDCHAPISVKSKGRCRQCSNIALNVTRTKRDKTPPPGDFKTIAAGKTIPELTEIYGRSARTISRWRAETGVAGMLAFGVVPDRQAPANFREIAQGRTVREIATITKAGHATVNRWMMQHGIARKMYRFKPIGHSATPVFDTRDYSRAGQAADFLRRFGPVVRCDAAGHFKADGDHWRRGTTLLTADEIIARAERNGWAADAWRQVAA